MRKHGTYSPLRLNERQAAVRAWKAGLLHRDVNNWNLYSLTDKGRAELRKRFPWRWP